MDAPQTFRTAFNGFNREDVVHFLEYTNNKHQIQLDALREENRALQSKLSSRPEVDPDTTAELERLRRELESQRAYSAMLEGRLDEANEKLNAAQEAAAPETAAQEPAPADTAALDAQIEDLNTELMLAQSRIGELEGQLGTAGQDVLAAQGKARALEEQLAAAQGKIAELERQLADSQTGVVDLYRRQQQAERFVREQSELVYHQANGVLSQAQLQVNAASQELTAATEEAMGQITALQMAIAQSRQALEDAASLMKAIRPVRGN